MFQGGSRGPEPLGLHAQEGPRILSGKGPLEHRGITAESVVSHGDRLPQDCPMIRQDGLRKTEIVSVVCSARVPLRLFADLNAALNNF